MGRVKTAVCRWLGIDGVERQNPELTGLLKEIELMVDRRSTADWKAIDKRIKHISDLNERALYYHLSAIFEKQTSEVRKMLEAKTGLQNSERQKIEHTHATVIELHRLVQHMDAGLSAGFKKLLEQFVLKNANKKLGAKNGTSTNTN
jgi:hypothetical protein